MNIGKNAEWKSIQFETCLWLLKRQSAVFVRMFILLRFKIIKSRILLKENIIRTLKPFNMTLLKRKFTLTLGVPLYAGIEKKSGENLCNKNLKLYEEKLYVIKT